MSKPLFSNKRVGGIRFLRVGRIQLSFCVCKPAPRQADLPRGDREAVVAVSVALAGFAALYGMAGLIIFSSFS